MHCCGISRYHEALKKLSKAYPDIKSDVVNHFKGMSFNDIFGLNYRIQDAGNYRLLKVRIANSYNQSGKSGGFRIYLIANLSEQHVTFLTIYPKTNKGGKDNLDKNDLRDIIAEYKKEKKDASLKAFNLIENDKAS